MFFLGLFFISLVFTGYMVLQYKSSEYFIYYAIIYGIVSQIIWALSIKKLTPKDIFLYGFIWDAALTLILLVVPFIVADISLSKGQIIGIALMIIGSVIIKIS